MGVREKRFDGTRLNGLSERSVGSACHRFSKKIYGLMGPQWPCEDFKVLVEEVLAVLKTIKIQMTNIENDNFLQRQLVRRGLGFLLRF